MAQYCHLGGYCRCRIKPIQWSAKMVININPRSNIYSITPPLILHCCLPISASSIILIMTPTITASSLEETPTIIIDPSEDTDQSTMNQIPAFPSMSLLSPASIRATNRTILYQKNDNQSTDSDSLESLCDYSRCHNGFSPPPMSIQPLDYSSVSQQVNSSTTQAFKPLSTDDTLSPENASRLLGEDSGEQTDGYTEREPDGHPNSPPSIKSMIHPIVYPDDVTVTVDIQSKILNHMRRKKDYRQMKTQNSRNLSTPCMRK